MSTSLADIAERITKEIEDAIMSDFPGQGILTVLGSGRGRMFVELPEAMQWKELNDRVNWTGLTRAQKYEVMARVLKDVQEKVPEEIYPGTWFDGILVSVDRDAKVFDLAAVRDHIRRPGRHKNFDERVCSPPPPQSQETAARATALFGGQTDTHTPSPEISNDGPERDPAGRRR
jgi:hypothetical protein